jgi:hypothetical protein
LESICLSVDPSFGRRYRITVERSAPPVLGPSDYRATYWSLDHKERPSTPIERERGIRIWEQLEGLKIDAAPRFAMGLDGTSHTLTMSAGFNRCELNRTGFVGDSIT